MIEFILQLIRLILGKKRPEIKGKGYLYLPTFIRDSSIFEKFRNETLITWLNFYKEKGVDYEVKYVDNCGPELVRESPSDVIFHYAINLNGNKKTLGKTELLTVIPDDATTPEEPFKSFARYQNIDNNYFGIREIDVYSKPCEKLCEVFLREVTQYGAGGKSISLYTIDEARIGYESHYYKEHKLVDSEQEISGPYPDTMFHAAEEGNKILVPCGHGNADYTTSHSFRWKDHSDKVIVSSTCHFLSELGEEGVPRDYLACFANMNYGWDSAYEFTNWFTKKKHYTISGSSELVAEFLKYKDYPIGVRAFYAFRNKDGGSFRIRNDGKIMGSKDKVAGESYDYADASFVLFGNPAFKI